jgi:hypothetical protein
MQDLPTIVNSSLEEGYFYTTLAQRRKDDDILRRSITETVKSLLDSDTSLKQPGILLGKIQSGKTRAFLGVTALAFDNGYDITIILTKGTKALVEQTLQRLHEDFGIFEEENRLQIHDIMLFPKNMVPYELSQKLIIVAKKETNNLKHVLAVLTTRYPDLKNKRILIIDDEADFASVSFYKEKDSGNIEQGKIAKQIDELRTKVERSDFLQVTATPYSLYLQPEGGDDASALTGLFPPKRPAFTVILPTHKDYIGGDYYFIESQREDSPAAMVYKEVPAEELEVLKASKKLKRADRRSFKIEQVFTSASTRVLRESIMSFIVGGSIRRIQQAKAGIKQESYSFIIHTEQSRTSHSWQEQIIMMLNEELVEIARKNKVLFNELVQQPYADLGRSIGFAQLELPSFEEVGNNVEKMLTGGMLVVEKVNSDKEVEALLDSKGQLKLRTPLNIFIGGQILDRGITIKNLIGFYYGRNPKKFQQDTVLQHSRMYGARSKEDLAVTRFYTTRNIYEVMRRIHEFDNALREAFESGAHDHGVYFIRKDVSNRLVPCSPNKILLSNVTTLKPYRRFLPIGFQTGYKTNIKNDIEELDKKILGWKDANNSDHFLVDLEAALTIIDSIEKTLVFTEAGYEWDVKAHKASLEHLSSTCENEAHKGKVWIVVRTNSDISRKKSDGRFADDVGSGTGETGLAVAKKISIDIPALILVRQNGSEARGWRGSAFWWPIILTPKNTPTTIFVSDTIDSSNKYAQ